MRKRRMERKKRQDRRCNRLSTIIHRLGDELPNGGRLFRRISDKSAIEKDKLSVIASRSFVLTEPSGPPDSCRERFTLI